MLKVGQSLIVLNEDAEYKKRNDPLFQKNRLFKIIKIDNGYLLLKFHLTAIGNDDLKNLVNEKKDELLWKYENDLGLSKVVEDLSIVDIRARKEDLLQRKYKFNSWSDFRMKRLVEKVGKDKAVKIKTELDMFKTVASTIEKEGETHLLKLNTSDSWNFLYEGTDFDLSILGKIKFRE